MNTGTREQAQNLFRDLVGDHDFSIEKPQMCYVSPKRFVEVISDALHTQAQSLVAAALAQADEAIWMLRQDDSSFTWAAALGVARRRVRALISSDAQAALDAHVREERVEEVNELRLRDTHYHNSFEWDNCNCIFCKRLVQLKAEGKK
jgi:hypothetical protein